MVPAAAKDNQRAEGLLSRVADSIAVEIMADLATRLERHPPKRAIVPRAAEQTETAKTDGDTNPEREAESKTDQSGDPLIK